ncbi:MAG: SIMPL domain-containing protein [Gemmataceae bacterium]
MRTVLASICVLLIGSATIFAADRTIRVAGDGKASATPDMATIQAGVSSRGTTAADALSANNRAMAAVLATLKDQGIAAKDVQTSHINIQPVYRSDNQGRQLNEIIAYDVSNQLRVQVRDVTKLGTVLDTVVRSGANQMSGVSFGFADSTAILDKARAGAIDDAKRRAKLYAQQAGVKIGKVLNISEQPIQNEPIYPMRGMGKMEFAGVPIAAGEEELRAQVYVEFALED